MNEPFALNAEISYWKCGAQADIAIVGPMMNFWSDLPKSKIYYIGGVFNIFNILTALNRVYIIIPINVGLRIKRGCF